MAAPVQNALVTLFPFGASSFGFPLIGSGPYITTGKIFFVDSTAGGGGNDVNHGTTPTAPFSTIAFAIGQCAAKRGDIIFVLPGHLESVLTAAGINLSVEGVRIIGVPNKIGRDRPKITLSTVVGASIDVNAASCSLENLVIDMTGVDNITAGINVKATDFSLLVNELITANAGGQAAIGVLTDANASRLRVVGNFFNGTANAGTNNAISITGGGPLADIEIAWNRFTGDYATGGIANVIGTTLTNAWIHDNIIVTLGTAQNGILIGETASRGVIADNRMVGTVLANLLIPLLMSPVNNYGYLPVTGTLAQIIPPVGAQLGASSSLVDQILGEIAGIRGNFFQVQADFSLASPDWRTVNTHRILQVPTGSIYHVKIVPFINTTCTSGGAGTISLGVTGAGAALIPATAVATLVANNLWFDVTPNNLLIRSGISSTPGKFIDIIVSGKAGSQDIGLTIAGAAFTGGKIFFFIWWEDLGQTGFATLPTIGTGQIMV